MYAFKSYNCETEIIIKLTLYTTENKDTKERSNQRNTGNDIIL